MTKVATVGLHRRPPETASREFRVDIEGLRAVAVLGVLAYHAAVPFLPGGYVGVDVFFVISGFLITGLIHAELERTGTLSIRRFYARRIKRLLPVAALVLVATAIASWFVLAPIEHRGVARDIAAAGLYVANWRFAVQQTDYLAAASAPSPVLHYWSLCVEEQFYLVWPFLMLAVGRFAMRNRMELRAAMGLALAVVAVPSLLWSITLTRTDQPFAFFGTPARMWELALGGAMALAAPMLVRNTTGAMRAVAGWAGLVLIGGSFLFITESTPFPGTAALWPAVGTALVIAGGIAPASTGVVDPRGAIALLRLPFMRAIGRVSYSAYLWHWPLLVLTAAYVGHALSPVFGVVVVAISFVPSWLTWRTLEEPFRLSKSLVAVPRRAFGLAGALTASVLVASFLLAGAGSASTAVRAVAPGGAVVAIDPAAARSDLGQPYRDGCFDDRYSTTAPTPCVYGAKNPAHVLALFGDSHALQWFPAIQQTVATQPQWQIRVYAKPSCTIADVTVYVERFDRPYRECDTWRANVLDELARTKPEVIVAGSKLDEQVVDNGERQSVSDSGQLLADGFARTYRRLVAGPSRVVVVADAPSAPFDVPTCLSGTGRSNGSNCEFTFDPSATRADVEAAATVGRVRLLDVSATICPSGRCYPVNHGTAVYVDDAHMTATFSRTLAPSLDRVMAIG